MSTPLSISRISEATTITDPIAFTDFCLSQLKMVERMVVEEKVHVPFDSILFHEYVILDYRQERMTIPVSDRLLEALFLFLQKCTPMYATEIANNVNNCFYRAFHASVMYLDNNKKLRGPEKLSENTTLAILYSINALLECVDKDTMHSFLLDIQTPYEESKSNRFQQIPFLPHLQSTPAKQFLESERSDSYFVILLYHLNELIENSSHQITLASIMCLESLLLTSGANHLLPILPSLLSSLAVTLRSNSFLSWREKALMTFLFAHALHVVVIPIQTQQPALSDLVADWLKQIHETPHVETPATPPSLEKRPGESQASFQGRRVTAELREKVPPLLSLVLHSVANESHHTLRLLVNHALFLLLRPSLTAFPSSVLSILDALVVDVTSDCEVLQSVSKLLMQQALISTLEDSTQSSSLFCHIHECMMKLPSEVRMKNEISAQHTVRCVLGYCELLQNHLQDVICTQTLLEEAELSLYEQMKQIIEIRDITNVSMESSSLFHLTFRYLNDLTASFVFRWITTIWSCVPASDELMLALLSDCNRGNREAAWLAQFIVSEQNRSEFIDMALDAIRMAQRHIQPNTEILLLSTTRLAIHSSHLLEYLPSLLSLLFTFRSHSQYKGLIATALWDLAHSLSYDSPITLAQTHAEYLLDSALLQLRLIDALSPADVSVHLNLLTDLWKDLKKSDAARLDSLAAHRRDTIKELCLLVHRRCVKAVEPLFPIVCILVRLCKEKQKNEVQVSDRVGIPAVIEKYITEKLLHLPSIEPRNVGAEEIDHTKESEEPFSLEEENLTETLEFTQLKEIVTTVQYCLRASGLQTPRIVLDILMHITELGESSIRLLLPTLPLLSSILRQPQNHLFADSVDLAIRIASLDPRITATRLLELWPLIREGLNGCLLAREGDFSVIQSETQGEDVELRLIHSLCEGYGDGTLLADCCCDVLAFLDQRWTIEDLPQDARRFITLAYRYNLDQVTLYLESRGEEYQFSYSTQWCRRFQASIIKPSYSKHSSNGVVVKVINQYLKYFDLLNKQHK